MLSVAVIFTSLRHSLPH